MIFIIWLTLLINKIILSNSRMLYSIKIGSNDEKEFDISNFINNRFGWLLIFNNYPSIISFLKFVLIYPYFSYTFAKI